MAYIDGLKTFKSPLIIYTHTSHNHTKQISLHVLYLSPKVIHTRINSRVLDFYNPPLGSFTRSDCFAHQYHPGHVVMAHRTHSTGGFLCNLYFICAHGLIHGTFVLASLIPTWVVCTKDLMPRHIKLTSKN